MAARISSAIISKSRWSPVAVAHSTIVKTQHRISARRQAAREVHELPVTSHPVLRAADDYEYPLG